MLNPDNPASLRVLLSFLKAARVPDQASSVLLLGTLLLLPHAVAGPGLLALGGAVLLGLLAKYLAWRITLDVEFFALLAEQPQQLQAFDAALAAFLGRPAPAILRPMASRQQGARWLLKWQAAALVAQLVALAAGVVMGR